MKPNIVDMEFTKLFQVIDSMDVSFESILTSVLHKSFCFLVLKALILQHMTNVPYYVKKSWSFMGLSQILT